MSRRRIIAGNWKMNKTACTASSSYKEGETDLLVQMAVG